MAGQVLRSLRAHPAIQRDRARRNLADALELLRVETVRAISGPPGQHRGNPPGRRTGTLARSVLARLAPDGMAGAVVATAPYAAHVERQNPFLAPTYLRMRPRLQAILRRP